MSRSKLGLELFLGLELIRLTQGWNYLLILRPELFSSMSHTNPRLPILDLGHDIDKRFLADGILSAGAGSCDIKLRYFGHWLPVEVSKFIFIIVAWYHLSSGGGKRLLMSCRS